MTESFRMVDDSVAYVSQAIALTQGTTSEFIADNLAMIGKYDLEYMTPTTYPWGFPLLLAILTHRFALYLENSRDPLCNLYHRIHAYFAHAFKWHGQTFRLFSGNKPTNYFTQSLTNEI